jgi:O-antigen ligase
VHASGRVSFWRPVLDGTLAHPLSILVGHGPTYSITVIQQALNEAIWSHNDFVDLFGTGGAILLIAYVGLVVWLFRSAIALARDPAQSERARDIGWLAVLVCGTFVVIAMFNDAVFASPTVAVGVLIGLARGMSRTPGTTFVD